MHQEVPDREVNGYLSFALAYPPPSPLPRSYRGDSRNGGLLVPGHAWESDGGKKSFFIAPSRLSTDASEFQCADAGSIGPLYTRLDFRLPVTYLLIVDSLPSAAESALRI